jgi:UDP-glucose 4-epimerase
MAFARMIEALSGEGEFEIYGDGLQTRSFTYVADAVDATIRALDAAPGVYNVGGGMRRTRADISRIRRELGWRPETALRTGLTRQWEWSTARSAAG